MIGRTVVGFMNGVTQGAVGAAMGTGCTAAGAAIMHKAGYHGYDAKEGATSGAVGGATVAGAAGLVLGLIAPGAHQDVESVTVLSYVAAHAMGTVVGSMVGKAILGAAGHPTMALGPTAAAAAVGAAVVYGGLAIVFGANHATRRYARPTESMV